MRPMLLRFVATIMVVGAPLQARGQTVIASSSAEVSITGRNSNFTFPSPVNLKRTDEDFDSSLVLVEGLTGQIDLGSATGDAFAFSGASDGSPDLLKARVSGSAQIHRPPLNPLTSEPNSSGQITISGSAKARRVEKMTFGAGDFHGTINVSGFMRLTSLVRANTSVSGPSGLNSLGASASATTQVTGNVIPVPKTVFVSATSPGGLEETDHIFDKEPVFFSMQGQPGVPIDVDVTLLASGNASIGGPTFTVQGAGSGVAEFVADVSHTLSWGGITSVTNSAGQPILNWTVTSESGYDYSQFFPIPEPSSGLMLAVGLGSVFLRRRFDVRRGEASRSSA